MLKYTLWPGAMVTVVGAMAVKLYEPLRTTEVGSGAPVALRSCRPG
jgi:hypothetical protein